MQYRCTPLNTGFSPSQLLNGRQLRTKIDALLPSPAHIAQEHQARKATKSQQKEQTAVQHVRTAYDVGTPCYALYCGPRQTSTTRWVPATITRVNGTRTFTVKVHPRGPLWKRHLEQLQPLYGVAEDTDPGVVISEQSTSTEFQTIRRQRLCHHLLKRKHSTTPCLSMEDINLGGHHARGSLDSCTMPNEHF